MRVLVTGGTGFLGAYLTRHLVESGDEVVIFDRYPARDRIADVADRVTVVPGDILEPQELLAAMTRHGIDRVVHLAGAVGGQDPERTVQYLRLQCMGTANVFETARLAGVKRIANASSVAVFGHGRASETQLTEDDMPTPNDLYGACKLWSEHVAAFHNERNGMEILSLRVCASLGYGRLNRASLAAGLTSERRNFMAAPEIAALGEPVTMPPDEEVSDFLYAADTAQAFRLALTVPRPEHSVFNLRAEQRPAGDLTRELRRLLPEARIEVSQEPVKFIALMDNSRLVRELGFEPRYTLETGLQDYVERVGRK
jgi:UDP-glucose 4-epimerase